MRKGNRIESNNSLRIRYNLPHHSLIVIFAGITTFAPTTATTRNRETYYKLTPIHQLPTPRRIESFYLHMFYTFLFGYIITFFLFYSLLFLSCKNILLEHLLSNQTSSSLKFFQQNHNVWKATRLNYKIQHVRSNIHINNNIYISNQSSCYQDSVPPPTP